MVYNVLCNLHYYSELKCSEKFNAMQVLGCALWVNSQLYSYFCRPDWGDGRFILQVRL